MDNGGLNFDMWGTIVDRDGVVCAVAFTGADRGQQWPGSRVISAQKANTANAFSLPNFALSTANLYTAVQPGGSLFGLQESNPVATEVAYSGNPANYGQHNDPMVGGRIGGVNVFGGGLGLYNSSRQLIGGIGVSGDTSCADHNIAYRTRSTLNLDYVPAGVGDAAHKDNAIYDITPQGGGDAAPGPGQMPGVSASGFGHPSCHGYNAAGNGIDWLWLFPERSNPGDQSNGQSETASSPGTIGRVLGSRPNRARFPTQAMMARKMISLSESPARVFGNTYHMSHKAGCAMHIAHTVP
jgi:uncharacterized protein GlcG (DUF336 family)